MSDVTPPAPGSILAAGFRALEQALAEVPEGKRGAMVFGATTDGVISIGGATRVGDAWALEGQLALDITAGKVRDVVGSIRAGVTWD